jgi:hypothetical protein
MVCAVFAAKDDEMQQFFQKYSHLFDPIQAPTKMRYNKFRFLVQLKPIHLPKSLEKQAIAK